MTEPQRQLIKKAVALSVNSYMDKFDYKEAGFQTCEPIIYENAFAFVLTTARFIFIVPRGTNTDEINDWICDAKFFKNDKDIHIGVDKHVDKIADLIDKELRKEIYDNKEIVGVGHSLGGQAIVAYLARIIAKVNMIILVGAPRVGGKKFWRRFKYKRKIVSIINYNDPVTMYPPVIVGYRDTPGDVIYFNSKGQIKKKPSLAHRWFSFFFLPKRGFILRNILQHDKETYLSLIKHVL